MNIAVRRTSTAIAAFATAGVSSFFFGAAPASAAAADACGPDATLVSVGVCEQVFTGGTASFTRTAQMTKLEALLVGAGGSGISTSGTTGYAAAGGGGEVRVVDFSTSTAPLAITVGDSSTPQTPTSVDTETAAAGGTPTSSTGGASGSGNAGASGSNANGGGGAGAAALPNSPDGGAGVTVSAIALTGSLFTDDSRCFGGGGAAGESGVQGFPGCGGGGPADATGVTLTAAAANSGGGGGHVDSAQTPEAIAGADGVVILRWNGATATLNFAANGHGAAPAAQTVAAGASAVKPADPTAAGFVFQGWYTDSQLTTRADFAAPVNGTTTYYASWAPALAATGGSADLAPLPLGIAALLVGAGLFAVARRKREAS